MDIPVDQAAPTPARRFVRTWRREIIRGGVLFGLVLGAGLFVRNLSHQVHVPSPLGALGAFGDFNWGDGEANDLFSGNREVGDEWQYAVLVKPSQHVWIRNTNGPIEVVAGTGDSLVVQVEKSWHMSDPQSVQLIPVVSNRGITICAVWAARESLCRDGGDYRINGVRKNDVAVRFTIQLPKGVPIDASTINGGLNIDGVSAPVDANTVNGRVDVTTSTGPINARTVNGSIEAVMQNLTSGDVHLRTTNGSVTAGLPRDINADLDATTVNGRVQTDFPVKVMGKISKTHLRGTIGNGGPTLKLITVNGSITLHEADDDMEMNPDTHVHARLAPVAPRAPRARVRVTPPPERP